MGNGPDKRSSEPPARRLGVLYVASLSGVALLSVFGQSMILREMTWQARALERPDDAPGQADSRPFLSSHALALQTLTDPKGREANARSLREAVSRWKTAPDPTQPIGAGGTTLGPPGPQANRSLRDAARHRETAFGAARSLLAAFETGPPDAPARAETWPLVLKVVEEEEASRRVTSEGLARLRAEASRRLDRLRTVEYQVFGFVLVVLAFEGLFVVSPAAREIERSFAAMGRTHEELKAYAAKLERSNRELQEFASVASHDLQEPLRKVRAFSDRVKTKYAAALDDQGRDYLDRVQNAAGRMQTLINDLLTYARVTTQAKPFVPVDLGVAAREVLSDLETRVEQVNGLVEIGDLPTVDADPSQVRQLLQNLIANALKYHRPEEPPRVRVYAELEAAGPTPEAGGRPGGTCRVLVEDNGIGFDEVYKERIFAIFQRLHGRTQYEGTGVGLAVCRKIAERHGGSITARSTPGQGSSFLVTLPYRQPQESNTDAPAS